MSLLRDREEDVMARLRCIAFTDSVHSVSSRESEAVKAFFTDGKAQNWVQSDKPLDTPIERTPLMRAAATADCPCVSAGHTKHEYTSPAAIDSVFAFLCRHLGEEQVTDVPAIDYTLPADSSAAAASAEAATAPAIFESATSVDNDALDED